MTPTWRIGLSIAVVLLLSAATNAAPPQLQFEWCANEGHSYPPDLQIGGCTTLIQSGSLSDDGLAHTYNNRGAANNLKGDYDRAIEDLNEAIRLDPKFAMPYLNRGLSYIGKRDYRRAIGEYDEAIRLDPKYARAYGARGSAYSAEKDYDRAIVDFDEAIRLDPKTAAAYNGRGRAYERKGDYDRAIADRSTAILLEPLNAAYLNSRCWLRAIVGRDLEEALTDCNESLRLRSGATDALNSRGLVHLRLGMFDKAIEDYSLALAKHGEDADSLYGRGIAKVKSGDAEGGNADMAAAKAIKADVADAHPWLGQQATNTQ